jgi:hypothetical protein
VQARSGGDRARAKVGNWYRARPMSDADQTFVPDSFIALYVPPGGAGGWRKPSAPRHEIAQRHEFCDDLAHLLVDTATLKLFEMGLAEADVLRTVHQGLLAGGLVNAAEAHWVQRRLAELLGWPDPGAAAPDAAG